MRLAVLADVHGNGDALRAVLAARRPYRLWIAEMLQRAAYVPLATFE